MSFTLAVPEVPENFTYLLDDITENKVLFRIDNIPDYSHKGYYHFIKYYSDDNYEYLERVSPNSTYISLENLNPAQRYHFIICMKDSKGSQHNLSPIIPVQTSKHICTLYISKPQKVKCLH